MYIEFLRNLCAGGPENNVFNNGENIGNFEVLETTEKDEYENMISKNVEKRLKEKIKNKNKTLKDKIVDYKKKIYEEYQNINIVAKMAFNEIIQYKLITIGLVSVIGCYAIAYFSFYLYAAKIITIVKHIRLIKILNTLNNFSTLTFLIGCVHLIIGTLLPLYKAVYKARKEYYQILRDENILLEKIAKDRKIIL